MKNRILVHIWSFLVVLTCVNSPAQIRQNPSFADPENAELHRFSEVSISPDGNQIVYVGMTRADHSNVNQIYVVNLADNKLTPILIGNKEPIRPGSQYNIVWSPDGKQIAFFGSEKSGQQSVFLTNVLTNSVSRICFFKGNAGSLQWSPDGKDLAFLFTENALGPVGPLAAAVRDTGVIEDNILVQRIAIISLASSQLHKVSPPDLYIFEYQWSPDGKSFAAIAAHPPGDNNWYIADLYRIEASTGGAHKLLVPEMQIAAPRWSPDGSQIAFIGGLMSDQILPNGDVYVLPAGGGHPRNLTPGMGMSASWIHWEPSSQNILFHAVDSGATTIASVNISSAKLNCLWHGLESIYANSSDKVSYANDGKSSAVIKESFDNPPEIWIGKKGAWHQITRMNENVRRKWGPALSLRWQSDSLIIQGWLILPQNYDSAHSYPMIVNIHGGPAGAVQPTWLDEISLVNVLSNAGYIVFSPNFRGSSGCGESFIRANVRDFGYGDLHDILNGLETVSKRYNIDTLRVGISGWSYGGYMAMWAVTQTTHFRAAISGAGISNWLSYYGQNSIARWSTSYFGGTVHDVPNIYARSSPINFIKQAKTPTLIIVGEGDKECPSPQSYEFWRGLQYVGVKTKLIVYPDAGHGISDKQYQDYCRQSLNWFNENMQ